jgi:hypothetical protein
MMRFTKRIDYGLMAMQYVAAHQGDGTIGQVIRVLERPVPDEMTVPVAVN